VKAASPTAVPEGSPRTRSATTRASPPPMAKQAALPNSLASVAQRARTKTLQKPEPVVAAAAVAASPKEEEEDEVEKLLREAKLMEANLQRENEERQRVLREAELAAKLAEENAERARNEEVQKER
jgi:hypothetical protein